MLEQAPCDNYCLFLAVSHSSLVCPDPVDNHCDIENFNSFTTVFEMSDPGNCHFQASIKNEVWRPKFFLRSGMAHAIIKVQSQV